MIQAPVSKPLCPVHKWAQLQQLGATLGWAALSTLAKLLAAFGVNKLVALNLGPAGVALYGQFQGFWLLVLPFATGAIDIGIIRQLSRNPQQRVAFAGGAVQVTLLSSLALGAGMMWQAPTLAQLLLQDAGYAPLFRWGAVCLLFGGLNMTALAILNGLRRIREYALLNTLIGVTGVVLAWGLAGATLEGYVFTLCLAQVVLCVGLISWLLWRFGPGRLLRLWPRQFFPGVRTLWRFSIMTAVSAACFPIANLLVRDALINRLSPQEAGYVHAMTKVSDAYLLVLTTTLATYYLPRLSAAPHALALRKEVLSAFLLILPLVSLSAFVLFTVREPVIELLFSEAFKPMAALFLPQLLGDVFKVSAWLLGYVLLAQAWTKAFVLMEVGFSSLYALSALSLIGPLGMMAAPTAFLLTNVVAFGVGLWLFKGLLFNSPEALRRHAG
jgi:PST family polysaccharide transporter